MINILNNEDITSLEKQIDQLIDFKPIPEHEVKFLCEKVLSSNARQRKYSQKRTMSSLSDAPSLCAETSTASSTT